MSTAEERISPDRAGLLSSSTVRQSQALTEKDRSLEPEDDRTRRFGYQPATRYMEMSAVLCGQTTGRVEPGVLTLFESFWHKAQNPSVDAADPSGPAIDKESLPGYHVANLLMQYREFGFRELRVLRGMSNVDAVDLFFEAHPPLHFAAEQGIMRQCIYDGEDVNPETGRREVCITCRRDMIDTLLKSEPTKPVKALLIELRDSIRVGRAHMASEWAKVLSELNTKPNPGMAPTLGSLKDDHYYFMRQLHERTPEALEMEKSNQATIKTAEIFKQAIGQQTAAITESTENAAIEQMRQQMANQQRQFEELKAQMTAKPVEAAPEAPATTEKAPPTGRKAK